MYYLPIHEDEALRLGLSEDSLLKAEIAVLPSIIGLSLASLLPTHLQYWSFWIIAVISSIGFYLTLQRLHGKLQWSKEAK
jgi:hypothetical protein